MKITHFSLPITSKIIIGLSSLVLTACSSIYAPWKSSSQDSDSPKKSEYQNVETKGSASKNAEQVREIRVAVPCNVPAINKPRWALNNISPSADDLTFFAAALQELEQRKKYETQLERALDDCRSFGN